MYQQGLSLGRLQRMIMSTLLERSISNNKRVLLWHPIFSVYPHPQQQGKYFLPLKKYDSRL